MSTEGEPLLSDEEMNNCVLRAVPKEHRNAFYLLATKVAQEVHDAVQAKIASGELRVCTPVKAVYGDHGGIMGWSCAECSAPCDPKYYGWCPGCGNPITE